MSDNVQMRFQLQKVIAYRELCRAVRHSGRSNVWFAALMGLFVYLSWGQNAWAVNIMGVQVDRVMILSVLIGAELVVGLIKCLKPSAECFLLDAFVVSLFTAYNLFIFYFIWRAGAQLNPVLIFFALYLLHGAVSRFKSYSEISKLFADRPSAEHLAWFDELIHEIREADPGIDRQALDLPTVPHWKAKLLGTTVFFVSLKDSAVWVLGPENFNIVLINQEYATETSRAILRIHDKTFPAFPISTATWENYRKWRDSQESSE